MAQYDIDLRDYWRIIRKRKPIIIFFMITLLISSFIFGKYKQRKIINYYSSSATIRIDKVYSSEERIMASYGFSESYDIATEVETIKSFSVMEEVALRSGMLPDSLKEKPEIVRNEIIRSDPDLLLIVNDLALMITPEQLEYTNIINVRAMSDDPVNARDLAQYVVETYKDVRKKISTQRIVSTTKFLEDKIKEVEAQMDSTQMIIQTYTSKYDTLFSYSSGNELSRDMVDYTRKLDVIDIRKHSTELMIDLLERDGVVDDSVLSNAYAEQEGGIFRQKYTDLMQLYSQRDELLGYFTPEHPEVRNITARIEKTKEVLVNQLKSNLKALQMQKESYGVVIENLRSRYERFIAKNDSLQRFEDKKNILQSQYAKYIEELQLVQIKKSEGVDEITIIKPAVIDLIPINTSTSMITISLLGLFLGMVIGLVAAFIFEALDTSIGTIEDVETYLNVPVIGLIPHIESENLKIEHMTSKRAKNYDQEISEDQAMLVIHYAPKSVLAESYRALRTNIQFISFEQEAKVLLFTSSSPREGKTTTIVNLALTMAQSNNRVLLVDADLRKPSIFRIFGLERDRGLSEIILGNHHWKDCIKTVTDIIIGELGMSDIILTPGIDNLHIITCGAIPQNPSELLNSESMDDFISDIRKEYDMVLFDCSPTLPATDSAVLGRKVDGVVLTYAVGRISRGSLKQAKAQMDNVKARVIGVVLNGMRSELSIDFQNYKYKEYYYTYEHDDFDEKKKGIKKITKMMGDFISRFVKGSLNILREM
ncbi:MAG TPA: AAA family ATPase [Anaerolineae bacterium]|nr:AAA family ATPase [Anaerolineae bacterium]